MSDMDILAQFADELREVGLVFDHMETTEGHWHHCGTVDRPNSKNGRYRFHLDPPANVSWKNRRTGEEGNFLAEGGPTLTAAEKEAQKAHRAQEKAKREQAEAEHYAKTAAQAQSIWNAAKPANPEHPYLVRKGVSVLGIRQRGELLVVPILDDSGKVLSLQYIMPEKGRYGRDKDYLKGKKKSGGFFSIPAKDGRTDGPLLICEGYATAASLHMATGYGVLVAFDTGGLKPVATVARQRYPEREIILCADNDVNMKDNPGVRYATAAAQSIGARLAICPTKEEAADFNDLHKAQGLDAVRAAVESAAPPDPSTLPESSEEDTAKPVQSSILPPPPRVPMQAFPQRIREIIEEAAEAYVVPEQVPAAALLALVSCMVGRSRAVEVKSGWREHGNIWLVIVAPSGLGKTPVANAFFKTINEMERRRHNEWKIANAAYTREWMDYNKAKPEKRGEAPEKPRRIQYYIDDSTEEALADALEQNPRGVMWKTDELSGTLASFEKYSSSGKKGGTKARLLSAYDCQVWKSGRVDAGRNLYIPAACVSIFGGMQPGMVSRCFDAEDSDSVTNARLAELANERLPVAVRPEVIGKAASALGLGSCRIGGKGKQVKVRTVPPEKLKTFKTTTVSAVSQIESCSCECFGEQQGKPPPLPDSTGSTVPITNRTTPQTRMALGGSTGSAGSTVSSSGDGKMSPSDIAAWCQREGLE